METPEIGRTVKTLSNEIGRCIKSFGDAEGVTRMNGWLIGYLYNKCAERDVFQKDIETDFNIRRSTVTGMLKLMEKNGLITRSSVSSDARLKKIMLTPKAIQIHEKIRVNINAVEKRLSMNLTDEEIESFLATANKMRENLKTAPADGASTEYLKERDDIQ